MSFQYILHAVSRQRHIQHNNLSRCVQLHFKSSEVSMAEELHSPKIQKWKGLHYCKQYAQFFYMGY